MPIERLLPPHFKELSPGFAVRRALPSPVQQAIGPFLFFDHFGPVEGHPGDNHDVRPHPHIGLATVTYLFEGAMEHRDSLGGEALDGGRRHMWWNFVSSRRERIEAAKEAWNRQALGQVPGETEWIPLP